MSRDIKAGIKRGYDALNDYFRDANENIWDEIIISYNTNDSVGEESPDSYDYYLEE